MTRILDRLILSSLSEASDPFFLEQHEVQAILYFGEGGMFSDHIKLYHRDTLEDGSLSPAMMHDGIDFLRESLHAGRRVLAVGKTGATIVAAYLTEIGMSYHQAIDLLTSADAPAPDEGAVSSHVSELERRASISLGHR